MLKIGPIAAFLSAVLMIGLVVATYIETDVLRFRGIVLALILAGAAAIIRSEAHTYVPARTGSRR